MLCFLYNYNYLLQSQSKLTNKLCVFKITMKFIDYNNLMNKRLCGQYLVDNTRFCGRYLVDIFFFRWSIFSKTPLAALFLFAMCPIVLWTYNVESVDTPLVPSCPLVSTDQHNRDYKVG